MDESLSEGGLILGDVGEGLLVGPATDFPVGLGVDFFNSCSGGCREGLVVVEVHVELEVSRSTFTFLQLSCGKLDLIPCSRVISGASKGSGDGVKNGVVDGDHPGPGLDSRTLSRANDCWEASACWCWGRGGGRGG